MIRVFLALVIVLLAAPAHAATWYVKAAGASTTGPADSCTPSHVTAAITAASAGDTVQIGAGTCSITSKNAIVVNKAITLLGAGEGVTIYTDDMANRQSGGANQGGTIISVTHPAGTHARIAHMSIIDGTASASCSSVQCDGYVQVNSGNATPSTFRIDHMTFTNGNNRSVFLTGGCAYGVIDHNTHVGNFVQPVALRHTSCGGGTNGDYNWSRPSSDFAGTASNVFVENNTFTNTGTSANQAVDCFHGCTFVFRYNTTTNMQVGNHGTESQGRGRSGRWQEIYENDMTITYTSAWAQNVIFRGGTGVVHNNRFTKYVNAVLVQIDRLFASFDPWKECDGTDGAYDDNEGVTYESGTHTGSSGVTVLTDSTKTWTVNEWQYSTNGYMIRNTTKGWGSMVSSNTSNTLTRVTSGFGNSFTWDTGDSYAIRKVLKCIDQPGRGQGTLLSGTTPSPTGYPSQELDPIRVWNNTLTSVTNTVSANPGAWHLQSSRDYYTCADSSCARSGYSTYTYPHPLQADESGVTPSSAANSTVRADFASVAANGTDAAVVTVTLLDANSAAVVGNTVTLADGACNSTITTVNGTSDANGVATFSVTNTNRESCTYTATDTTASVTITQTAAVTFTGSGGRARMGGTWR